LEEIMTPNNLDKHLAVTNKRLALLRNALEIIGAVNVTSIQKAASLGDPTADTVIWKAHSAAAAAIAESDRLGAEEGD
jgi:hypothetical protein